VITKNLIPNLFQFEQLGTMSDDLSKSWESGRKSEELSVTVHCSKESLMEDQY